MEHIFVTMRLKVVIQKELPADLCLVIREKNAAIFFPLETSQLYDLFNWMILKISPLKVVYSLAAFVEDGNRDDLLVMQPKSKLTPVKLLSGAVHSRDEYHMIEKSRNAY